MDPLKAGVKTSEFWTMLIALAIDAGQPFIENLAGHASNPYVLLGLNVLAGLFIIGRKWLKALAIKAGQ